MDRDTEVRFCGRCGTIVMPFYDDEACGNCNYKGEHIIGVFAAKDAETLHNPTFPDDDPEPIV